MKKRISKIVNLILILGLTFVLMDSAVEESILAEATTISEVEGQITKHENELEEINEHINELTDEQDLVQELIDDLNAEIINTMTSIGMKEDEIAEKEAELSDKQLQLSDKQEEIEQTQAAYEEAKTREEKQYADMLVRIRAMYENGTDTYLGLFLKGSGFADMLNRMDYVEKIYGYDRLKLEEYEETRQQVHDLWDQLEIEKQGLELEKTQIEEAKAKVEADKVALEDQKLTLDKMLKTKKEESANYEAEINRYKQDAAVAKKLLQQEKKQLQQLQQQLAAQQNKNNSSAANGTYVTTSYTSIIDNAAGSDLGKRVAKYACQYIGNPYVYGGTSLTNGADCSGFTFRVYKDFNYSLPRTSYEQRSAGTGVNYSDAQPGDLICYDGHIGIYIGGGKIVHASSAKTGIKVSDANYRTILSVRRIIK